MIFGPILAILVLTAVIAAVMLILRWPSRPRDSETIPTTCRPVIGGSTVSRNASPRNEIDQDEYEERRRVRGE
jgi:putative membrane protein